MVEMVVVGKEEEEEEEMVFTASFTAPPGADALMWAQSRARLQREGLRCTFSSSLPSLKFCCIENLFIFPLKVEMLWRRGGLEEESVHNKCPFG